MQIVKGEVVNEFTLFGTTTKTKVYGFTIGKYIIGWAKILYE